MNKRFTLASLAIVLGICAFIFFTQTQVLTVSRPAVHAQETLEKVVGLLWLQMAQKS